MSEINKEINNEMSTDSQKMQEQIQELQLKYEKLSQEVEQLENHKTNIGTDIKEIHGEFEQINKKIEMILEKLNGLSDEYDEMETDMDDEINITRSMKGFFTNPLRKIAVGTLSAVYAIADMTIEKTSSFKESLEDIVAEAQYSNKKRKFEPADNS